MITNFFGIPFKTLAECFANFASPISAIMHDVAFYFDRLVLFKPDFIFCSAGFDAHEYDHIHGSGDTGINEFDYEWLTENLQKIANQYCEGRLISVFEGGYNIKLGAISPLVQSVAAHVRTLKNTNSGPLFQENLEQES